MAITLIQPQNYICPAFNKIPFKALSNNVLQTGFKYAVQIRNVKTNTIIATTYYLPDPDPAEPTEFDISYFLQGEFDLYQGLTTDPNAPTINGNGWKRTDSFTLPFNISVYEYYDFDGNGLLEIVPASVVNSNDYLAIPMVVNPYEINFFDGGSLWGFGNNVGFTDFQTIKLPRNSFYNFAFFDNLKQLGILLKAVGGVIITEFDSNNTLIQTTDVPNTTIPTEFENASYFHFRGSSLLPNTKYAKLTLYYTIVGTQVSQEFATIYPLECLRSTSKTLFFLNKYGAYDSYTFPLNNFTSNEVNRSMYKRRVPDFGYVENGDVRRYRNTNPVYYSRIKTKMTLQTNWLSDTDSELLQQLFSSSSVYLLDNDNVGMTNTFIRNKILQPPKLIPVSIVDKTYEIKYNRAHRNFQYTCNVEFAELDARQTL